ncbi:MAG: response regulator [Nitrospiraceae bacterium]
MRKPRVLLADDHTLVLEGFRKLLEEEFELVGTVEDGRALLTTAPILQPDVVLLDIAMPSLNGIEAARQLKKMMPEVKIIFVTMHADSAYVTEGFRAGASGYLLKRSAAAELAQAIQAVLRGQHYVTPLITSDLVRALIDSPPEHQTGPASLTPRQREVLQLVAEGHSLKEIANTLKISVKTVEFHKAQIMEQLNLHTTAELTKYAITHGLTSP